MKGDVYHILNKGVEKRDIFLDNEDYFRFRDDLRDFNTKKPIIFSHYDRNNYNLGLRLPGDELVEILCVCLMPNHFHILVREKINGGTGLFSQKLGVGYTHYFNQKNKRSGVLFQGRSKRILANNDAHFVYLPYYILANPLKIIEPIWKDEGINDVKKAVQFLDSYKWTSFRDVVHGKKGVFSGIINKELFLDIFDYKSGKEFGREFGEWLGSLEIRPPS